MSTLMQSKKNTMPKLAVSVLFIVLTIVIIIASLLPIFTVKSDEMTGPATQAYEEGYFTYDIALKDEIEIGLMPLIKALPNIKHLIFVIGIQEESNLAQRLLKNANSEQEIGSALAKIAVIADKVENYSDKDGLSEALEKDELRDAVQMYYALRYLVLDYFLTSEQIMEAAIIDTSDEVKPIWYTISVLLMPIIMVALLAPIICGYIARLIVMSVTAVKNIIGLPFGFSKSSNTLPDKVKPRNIYWEISLGMLLSLKLVCGDLIKLSPSMIIIFITYLLLHFATGFYKILAENGGGAKNWCRWLVKLCIVILLSGAIFAFADNSIIGLEAYIDQGNFASANIAFESYVKRILLEFVLKLVGIAMLVGYCESVAEDAEGRTVKIGENYFVTLIGDEPAFIGAAVIAVITLVLLFIYPGQSILGAIMVIFAVGLEVFVYMIPKILNDPDPEPYIVAPPAEDA